MEKYNYINPDFEQLFIDPEKISDKWYHDFYYLSKKGDTEGLNNLFAQAENLYWNEYHIFNTISQLMNSDAKGEKKIKLLNQLKECGLVTDVEHYQDGDPTIIIKTPKGTSDIAVAKLSDIIPEFKNYTSLEGPDRQGQCHEKSREISLRLGFPNQVVTGWVFTISDVVKHLHSWVEFTENGRDFVIDFTLNAIINKNAYYFLRHVEILCEINDTDILSDLELFSSIKGLNLKEYLVFRRELAKSLINSTNIEYKV